MIYLWYKLPPDGGPGYLWSPAVGRHGKLFHAANLDSMVMNSQRVLKELLANDLLRGAEWKRFLN